MAALSSGKEWMKRLASKVRRVQPAKAEASEKGTKLKDKASSKLKAGGTVTGGTNLNKKAASNTITVAGKPAAAGGKLNVAGKK